jgi:RNA polymerase sigma-70 factor, ECF subfamily
MLLADITLADHEPAHYVDVLEFLYTNSRVEPEAWQPSSRCAEVIRRIEREIPFLRRAVRRWQRNAADADDLVQETLLRALSSAHLWQPGSNLRAWLLTIMRNQFLAIASRSRRCGAALEMIGAIGRPAVADTETRLTLRDVERAVRRLPEKQRAAVLLAGIEGKSYAEIAAVLGLSPDAVRCHLARARDRLRAAVFRAEDTTPLRRGEVPRERCAAAPGGVDGELQSARGEPALV